MGGTIGTAAFLSILFSVLPNKISDAYAAARGTAEFQQAAAAHPEQLQALSGAGGGGALSDTSFIQRLDAALAAPFKTGFSDSIDLVFLVAACVVAVGFFVLVFLPQLPLRTQSGLQARQDGAGEAPAEGTGEGTGESTAETTAKAAGAAAPTSVSPASAPAAGDGTRGDGGGSSGPASGAAALDGDVDGDVDGDPDGNLDGEGRHGRHEAGAHEPTGLASIPAEHLPEDVRGR
jgi:hypothetical protein